MWFSGILGSLALMDKSFWYQGFGLRSLFLKYEQPEKYEPIFDDDSSIVEADKIYEAMKIDLVKMKAIKTIKTTPEFMKGYNSYREKVIRDIQDVQSDILQSQDTASFPIISKVKHPVLVMKLALIHAASRYNIENDILTLETEDLQSALEDLKGYHENMIDTFYAWEEMTTAEAKIENIPKYKDKFRRHIISAIHNKKGFDLNRIKTDEGMGFEATKADDGIWISHALLLKNSSMTSKKFSEIVDTLIEQLMVSKREGILEKNGIRHLIIFYSLIDSKKSD